MHLFVQEGSQGFQQFTVFVRGFPKVDKYVGPSLQPPEMFCSASHVAFNSILVILSDINTSVQSGI